MKKFTLSFLMLLSTTLSFASDISVNDTVIDSGNDIGKVLEVFINGRASVKYEKYNKSIASNISDLSKSVNCHSGFCLNDRVIDGTRDIGTIQRVFSNGKAEIQYDRLKSPVVMNISTIAKSVECINNVCVNDRVMDHSGDVGTLEMIFNNGTGLIKYDRLESPTVMDLKIFGYDLRCSQEKLCKGSN